MKNYLLISAFSILLFIACDGKKEGYHIITEKEYQDKSMAAWLGQMAGVGWGAPTEFRSVFRLMEDSEIPVWRDTMINQFGQDDLYVEMTFLQTLQEHGFDVSMRQAGIDFANSLYGLACANEAGRENLRAGIAPPESGHPDFSTHSDDIDYQIEADYSGIISPGMPNRVIELGEKFGKIMNYGDGVYGGIFMGGMYAAAFFETDRVKIVEAGLACIPEQSDYAQCIRDMLQWYREDSVNWQNTWRKIDRKYVQDSAYQKLAAKNRITWPGIDAKLNGAYVLLGLLYGKGNIDSTITIAMRAGLDSDCNPSSAAGVLFTTLGYEKVPDRFKTALAYNVRFSHTNYDFDSLIRVCTMLTRQQVIRSGGKIDTSEAGEVIYHIPREKPAPGFPEQSFNPAPANRDNRFSEQEMNQIGIYASATFNPFLSKTAPGWRVDNCGKDSKAGWYSWYGRDSVLALQPPNPHAPVYISTETSLPANKKSSLRFIVSCQPGEEWKLEISVQWVPKMSVFINDEVCKNGWYPVHFDLSAYQGIEKVFIAVSGSAGGRQVSKTYWDEIKIISQ